MPVQDANFAPRSSAVAAELQKMNRNRAQPLTKFQQQQIAEAKPVFIYNVSPIHEWRKPQGQLGTVVIPKREKGERVSKPYSLRGAVPRWYDKGLGRKEVFIESGIEIAEDICGCSQEFPVDTPNNNLTNFGVFITLQPFDELPKKEQDKLLDDANAKLMICLRKLVLEADLLHPATPKWVGQIHRDALNALNELEGTKEQRPWAPISHAERGEDCKFCGSKVKIGIVVCPTCRNVLDEEKYAKMQGKKAS